MKRCESCGAENSAQATFCAKCGKKLQNKEYSGRAAERESALSEDTIVFSEPIVAKTSSTATSSSSQPELESEKTELAEQDVDLLYTGPRQAASARKTAQSTRDARRQTAGDESRAQPVEESAESAPQQAGPAPEFAVADTGRFAKKERRGVRRDPDSEEEDTDEIPNLWDTRERERIEAQEGPQSELDELLAQEDAFSAQGSSSQTGRGRIVLFAVLATVVVSICAVCAVVFFSLGQEPPVSDQTEPTQTVEEPQAEPEPEQTQPETQTPEQPEPEPVVNVDYATYAGQWMYGTDSTGKTELNIKSVSGSTVIFDLKVSSPAADGKTAQITDCSAVCEGGMGRFTFEDDGFGNAGSGTLVFGKNQVGVSATITSAAKNAAWRLACDVIVKRPQDLPQEETPQEVPDGGEDELQIPTADGVQAPSSVLATSEKLTVSAEGGLNLRKAPDTSAEKQTLIPDGSEVVRYAVSEDGTWSYISYANYVGWVSSKYLVLSDAPDAQEDPDQTTDEQPSDGSSTQNPSA